MEGLTAQFIDFVEQEDRIDGPSLGHALDDAARHRADVGAAMAADFGFVRDAAKGRLKEFAA